MQQLIIFQIAYNLDILVKLATQKHSFLGNYSLFERHLLIENF